MMIEYSKYNIRELEELLEHKNRIIQEYELKPSRVYSKLWIGVYFSVK